MNTRTFSPLCSPGTSADGVKAASLALLLNLTQAHGAKLPCLCVYVSAPANTSQTHYMQVTNGKAVACSTLRKVAFYYL